MKDHLPPNTIKQPFDVFLSHNSKDKSAVEALASRLTDEAKLQVWLDKWHLIPGEPWQEEIERALDQAHTCAVFLGPNEFGSWHHEEMRAALDQRVADRTRKFRVIPVLLPGATMPDRSKLPAFLARLTWVDFRQGLEDAEAFHRLVAGIRGIVPGRPEGGAMPANVECPYRGLEVFDEEHARFFFGREAMTQHLVEALRPTRFLCVLGPSGSGKSSLARAGLLPLLRAGQLPGSRNWQYLVFKPGAHPIEELALSLAALQTVQDQISAADQLINNFKTTETALHLFARLWLRNHAPDTRLFLLVDQFEEVFTLCQDATEREQFIKNLRYAGTIEGGRTVIVPTMRADFLNRAAESPDLAELLSTHQFIVNPMEPGELRRAIEEPALLAGLRFEPGLVERILSDVGHEPGALPLLEHALRELFEKRNRENVLTMQAYEQSGGVQGALAQKAETIYARFKPEQQTILRRVMLRLTQPGEGTVDTRRRAAQHELWNRAEERAAVEQVIHTLADERLLTTNRDASGEEQLDVAHEALIRGWPRLRNWINDDREGLRLRHRLTEDSREWLKQGKDKSYLYQGARLVQAAEWMQKNEAEVNELEREFLEVGSSLQKRLQQEEMSQRSVQLFGAMFFQSGHRMMNLMHEIRSLSVLIEATDKEPKRRALLSELAVLTKIAMESLTRQLNVVRQMKDLCLEIQNLRELIVGALQEANVSQRAPNLEVQLRVPEKIFVQADQRLIQEAFLNIFYNAIRILHQGGSLTISATLNSDNQVVQTTFTHTGIGMSTAQIQDALSGSMVSQGSGTGFGLFVSRLLVHAMHGDLKIESQKRKETKLIVTLPRV